MTETWSGKDTVDKSLTTKTKYTYTSQGQLQTVMVVRQDAAAVSGSPATTYTYDADGNVKKIVYPNNTETDYDYSQVWNTSGGIETVTNERNTGSGSPTS